MKFRITLFAAVLISLSVNAQTITWGLTQKATTDSKPDHIVGIDDKAVYMLKYYNSGPGAIVLGGSYPLVYTLEKYDLPDMKREFSKEIDLTEDGSEKGPVMYCDGVFMLKDNMVALVYGNDVKSLYGMKVGADGTVDRNNKVLIGKVDNRYSKSMLSEYRYGFAVSKDKTALVAYYVSYKDKTKILLTAVDENCKQLWSKEIQNPFPGKKESNVMKACSTDGKEMYVLVSFGDKDKPDGYGVLAYSSSTGKSKAYEIKLDGTNKPNLAAIGADNNGNAVIAGFYGDEKSKRTSIGTYNVRIDNTGKELVNKTTEFDKDFLAHIISDNQVKKGNGIDDFSIKGIYVKDDGSAVVYGEQGNFYGGSITQSNYDDGIISYIKTDGTTSWTKSIAKKQASQFAGEAPLICSYGVYVGATSVYVIYNDDKKNAENNSQPVVDGDNSDLSRTLIATGAGHPALACEVIDIASGSATRKTLSSEAGKVKFYSIMSCQFANGIVYRGDGGKDDQLGTLPLQ